MNAVTFEEPLQDQAESWVVRLNSDLVSEQDIQQFALWLAESEEHRHCFDQVLVDWQALGVVRELPFDLDAIVPESADNRSVDNAPTADLTAVSTPVSTAPESTADNVIALSARRRKWSAVAVAASLLLAVVLIPQWMKTAVSSEHYQSGIGEQRTVALTDGSIVVLNTNTRLTVSYSEDQRQVTLSRGEAFFEVAKDRERPFTVNSCGAEARALGTAFNVRCELQAGAVTVTEGTVQVTDLRNKDNQQQQRILSLGQQLPLSDSGDFATPLTVIDDSATSWRNGELVFNGATLRDIINEISRYTSRTILIGSPALAATEVTGRFDIQDAEALLVALQGSFQMEVVSQPDGSLLLKKASL